MQFRGSGTYADVRTGPHLILGRVYHIEGSSYSCLLSFARGYFYQMLERLHTGLFKVGFVMINHLTQFFYISLSRFDWNTIHYCFSSYSARHLRFDARVTRFTFSAAISKSLELKRSSIAL